MIGSIVLFAAIGVCDPESEAQKLLDNHAEILRAHLEDDVEGWAALEVETLLISGSGRMSTQGPERHEQRRAYLEGVGFDTYEDSAPPIATVSNDCSLGWIVAEVRANGASKDDEGQPVDVRFQASWIELYAMTDQGWRMTGNVSNFE